MNKDEKKIQHETYIIETFGGILQSDGKEATTCSTVVVQLCAFCLLLVHITLTILVDTQASLVFHAYETLKIDTGHVTVEYVYQKQSI